MKVYKNFLPKKEFTKLKNYMMGIYMPWYFNDGVVDTTDKNFQFTYIFLKDGKKNCEEYYFNLVQPILNKIKFKNLNKIKANLLTKDIKNTEHGMHVDQPEGTTGIFYINTCNGYTKFKNNKIIKSKENTYVEFDSSLQHTGSSCTDEKRRVVINFNYS
jgi:hypothetical protein|tara:strand:+ start:436 stop:912 length:477 start_codon:yes stop_codon:yes gene_type:complete